MSELLKPEELSKILKVSRMTITRWHREGIIPSEFSVGRVYRFDLMKVRDALAARAATKRVCTVCRPLAESVNPILDRPTSPRI